MKRVLLFAVLAALIQVTFVTSLDCEHCATKIRENVSFEKGVRDLTVDVPEKTVTIVYNPAKTDTLKLGNSIRSLGYSAKVVDYKEIIKK